MSEPQPPACDCSNEAATSHLAVSILRLQLILFVCVVLLQVVVFFKEVGVHGSRGCYRRLEEWMTWVCTLLRDPGRGFKSDNFEARVQEMKRQQRVQRFMTFSRTTSLVVFLFHLNRVVVLLRLDALGNVGVTEATNETFWETTLYPWLITFGIPIMQSFRRVTTRTLDGYTVICFLGWATACCLQPSGRMLFRDLLDLRLCRLIVGMLTGNFRLNLVLNLSLTSLLTVLMANRWTDDIEPDYTLRSSIVGELGMGLAAPMLFSLMLASWDDELARSNLSARLASQGEAAVRTLLSALCDAVVRIDDDCQIKEPCPQLGGMLLHSSPSALHGTSFLNVVVEEDRASFCAYLRNDGAAQKAAVAPAMHVRLRDSTGNRLLVQLLHGAFYDVDDQRGHLIGICDLSGDREHEVPDATVSASALVSKVDAMPAIGEVKNSLSSAASSSSFSSGRSAGRELCQVDFTASPPHVIKWCSYAFIAKYGPVNALDSLDKWIVEPASFLPAMEQLARCIFAGTAQPGVFTLGELRVRKASGRLVELPSVVFFPEPSGHPEHDYVISLQFDRSFVMGRTRSRSSANGSTLGGTPTTSVKLPMKSSL